MNPPIPKLLESEFPLGIEEDLFGFRIYSFSLRSKDDCFEIIKICASLCPLSNACSTALARMGNTPTITSASSVVAGLFTLLVSVVSMAASSEPSRFLFRATDLFTSTNVNFGGTFGSFRRRDLLNRPVDFVFELSPGDGVSVSVGSSASFSYSQLALRRIQFEHIGRPSSHLIRLSLHPLQPVRLLLWKRRVRGTTDPVLSAGLASGIALGNLVYRITNHVTYLMALPGRNGFAVA